MTAAPGTFATQRGADSWLAAKRAELDSGSAMDEVASRRPLQEWWPGYWRSTRSCKEVTRVGYEAAWRLRVEPRFGSMPVRRITPSHIDEWVADLLGSGHSASKVAAALGVLKRVLDRAVRDRVIPANPCAQRSVTLPRRAQNERPVLSPADVERLAAAMSTESDRVLLRLLAYGGLRIGEAFALQWSDLDLRRQTLAVRRSVSEVNGQLKVGPTNTHATRTVVLPDALVAQLTAISGSEGLVFPNRNGDYRRYRNFRRDVWNRACEQSDVVALPHDLRGTCASLLINAGASPKDVQAHLGHQDVQTTLRLFLRVRPDRNVDIAERLNAFVAEVPDDARPLAHKSNRTTASTSPSPAPSTANPVPSRTNRPSSTGNV